MSKYEPLREFLAAQKGTQVRLTFAEVSKILGEPLPTSAFKHRAWWANQSDTTRRQHAAAWFDAGFKVGSVHQLPGAGKVEFVRR